jgi:ABC-type antimicrobial peptide transport system permease subunit
MGWEYKSSRKWAGGNMYILKPLSILNYLKNNIIKVVPQIFAVSVGVFLVYFLCILGGGVKSDTINTYIKPLEKASFIYINNPGKDSDICYKQLQQNKYVKKLIWSSEIRNILGTGLVADQGVDIFFTNINNAKYLMKMYGFKLIKGKIPEHANELLINNKFAISKKLKLGSFYGTDVNTRDNLSGKFKVTGIYDGKIVMAFGGIRNKVRRNGKNNYSGIIVIPKAGKLKEFNESFSNSNYGNIGCENLEHANKSLKGYFQLINTFLIVILLISVFVITFAIGNISYMHFYDRIGEFSIFVAVGYSKKSIILGLVRELSLVIFAGFGCGLVFGILGGIIFNLSYCNPRGVPVDVVNFWYIFISFMVPILVALFSAVPIIRFIRKMNTMDVLEGRF